MSNPAGHVLVLPFDTDDAAFVRGFEAGNLWARLRAKPGAALEQQIHASNIEMVLRMAEAMGRPVTSNELGDDGWVEACFEPAEGVARKT